MVRPQLTPQPRFFLFSGSVCDLLEGFLVYTNSCGKKLILFSVFLGLLPANVTTVLRLNQKVMLFV